MFLLDIFSSYFNFFIHCLLFYFLLKTQIKVTAEMNVTKVSGNKPRQCYFLTFIQNDHSEDAPKHPVLTPEQWVRTF